MFLKRMLAGALGAAAVTALALPGAASAAPAVDTAYFNQVVSQLKSSKHHVYLDPRAKPTITGAQASTLESQITGSGKSIYVLLLDNDKAPSSTPAEQTQLLAGLHQAFAALGSNAQVIGASTKDGFYANGFNVPSVVANQAGPLAKSAARTSGKDPFKAYTTWVTSVAAIKVATNNTTANTGRAGTSTRTSTAAPVPQKDGHGWVIFWIILGSLVLVGVIVWIVVRSRKRKSETNRRKTRVKNGLETVNTELLDIYGSSAPSSAQTRASLFVQKGQDALAANDIESAEEYLEDAQSALEAARAEANQAGSPVQPYDGDARTSDHFIDPQTEEDIVNDPATGGYTPQGSQRTPRAIRARRPDGSTVVVNNTTYQSQSTQQPGFDHFYAGGLYNGMYMAPGFYQDPFWSYVLAEKIFDDHHDSNGSYADGYRDGEREDQSTGNGAVDTSPTTGNADGGDWADGDTTNDWTDDSGSQTVGAGTTDGGSWEGSDNGTDSGTTDSGSSWSSDPAPAADSGSSSGGWDSGSSSSSSSDSGSSWSSGDSGGGSYDSGSSFDSGSSSDSGGGW